MASTSQFAEVAALAGDPARAAMLHALMDGRALTATELARVASITPQTASGHLGRLVEGGIVAVERQGRHRYHRLASAAVAQMMESIMQVASGSADGAPRLVVGPRDAALRAGRTCYDHLAGQLGVALADAMINRGAIELTGDAGLVTDHGLAMLGDAGIDIARFDAARGKRSARVLCRPCLDWSERRPHIAGIVGAALCSHSLSAGWVRRIEGSRAVAVTPKGRRLFADVFGARLAS